jgi:hypothetical protein
MQTSSSTTSVATSNGNCVGSAAISAAATPGSYMYTSSSGLLRSSMGDKAVARAVPPPTLPKYSGASSSFRLASLDRLAHRQRQFDQQQQGSGVSTPQQANGDVSPSQQQQTAVSFNAGNGCF